MRALCWLALLMFLAGCSDAQPEPAPTEPGADTASAPEDEPVPVRAPREEGASVSCDFSAAGIRQNNINLETGENTAECVLTVDTLDPADPLPFKSALVGWEWDAAPEPTLQEMDLEVDISGGGNSTVFELSGDPSSSGSEFASGEILPIEGTATVRFTFTWSGITTGFAPSATVTLYETVVSASSGSTAVG